MLLDEAVRIGEAAESRNAWELTMSLRWFMHAELANWDQVGDLAAAFDPDAFGAPWAYVTRALLTAQTGDRSLARGQLDAVAPRLRGMERDSEWLPTMAQVAELVGLVGGHPVAAWMYEALPHRDRFAVEGIGAAVRGPVERDLGVVAATLGRDEAAGHFDAAVAACERIGAACLAARTLRDAGVALADAARLQAARPTSNLVRRTGSPSSTPSREGHRRHGRIRTCSGVTVSSASSRSPVRAPACGPRRGWRTSPVCSPSPACRSRRWTWRRRSALLLGAPPARTSTQPETWARWSPRPTASVITQARKLSALGTREGQRARVRYPARRTLAWRLASRTARPSTSGGRFVCWLVGTTSGDLNLR